MREDFIVVIDGDTYVGKTTIIQRLIKGKYGKNTQTEYEPGIYFKKIEFDRLYTVKIIDMLGAKRYDHLREQFYKEANSLIIIFDLTDKFQTDRIEQKIKIANENGIEPHLVILVGNKVDLEQDIYINYDELADFLVEFNIKYYLETSAKDNINIKELFELAAAVLGLYSKGYVEDKDLQTFIEEIKLKVKQIVTEPSDLLYVDLDFNDLEQQSIKTVICPYCNNDINQNARICPICGVQLK